MKTIQTLFTNTVAGVSRKFAVIAVILIVVTTSAFASPTEISAKVMNHFKSNYTTAKSVTWTVTKDNLTRVSFVENNVYMEVFYNREGDVIASSKRVDLDDLPARGLKNIVKNYPPTEFKPKQCIKLTNVDNETSYYVSLEDSIGNITILQVSLFGDVKEFTPAN